jgi:hypothetical protein
MSSKFLPVFIANADADLQDRLPDVLAGKSNLRSILDFCQCFRVKGIGTVLLRGSTEDLFPELSKSGRAFLFFLENRGDADKATGRSTPFFDAVSAGDFACAHDIAVHSRTTWNPDVEYEDDFCFVWLLMQLYFLGASVGDCKQTLARHLAITGQDDHPQYKIGLALLDKDEAALQEGLVEYLQAERVTYRELERSGQLEEEVIATEPYLSVQGLAIIRLAESTGIHLPARQKGLPAVARRAPSVAYDPGAWRIQ